MPTSDTQLIDIDAPMLAAYEVVTLGVKRWMVRCNHCERWHRPGAAEGHREAHCNDSVSPYWKTGCNLVYAGEWKPEEN